MSIFNPSTWFKKEKPKKYNDSIYLVPMPIDDTDKKKEPKKVTAVVRRADMVYNSGVGSRSKTFFPSEYDLHDVASAYDADGYFRKAVDKYVDLIWRNGFTFVSQNPDATKYIKLRFQQIAKVTGGPTKQFFEDISQNLVLYANTFILKVRGKAGVTSGGAERITFDGKRLDPVAGYFVADSPNMKIARNEHGTILRYKTCIPGKLEIEFKPDNVIHVPYDRKPGTAFGTPVVMPVMADIEALRKMEENVEILVFNHSIPFFEYIIGTEDKPAELYEIDEAVVAIQNKQAHGVFVHSGRNKLDVVGAKRDSLDASPYMEHYKNRIWSGLGMTAVAYGESGSSNKSTSQTLTFGLQDSVKRFQEIITTYVNEFIINELLEEGGFRFDEYNPKNKVELFLPEIDIDTKIKKENHYSDLMMKNIITHDEARKEMGRDPFTDADWDNTYFELVTLKQSEIANAAKATDGGKSIATKEKPTNQHKTLGVKPSIPMNSSQSHIILKKLRLDAFKQKINSHYVATKEDIIVIVEDASENQNKKLNQRDIESLSKVFNLTKEMMTEASVKFLVASYMYGVDEASKGVDIIGIYDDSDINNIKSKVLKNLTEYCDNLKQLIINRQLNILTSRNKRVEVNAIFSSLSFVLDNLTEVSLLKAFNMGKSRFYKDIDLKKAGIIHINTCDRCKKIKTINIPETLSLDSMPPFESGCICTI